MGLVSGSCALVTGSNRGLGRSLVDALLAGGAERVIACARDTASLTFDDPRVVAMQLDVTQDDSVERAAALSADVDVVVNNAAALFNTPLINIDSLEGARLEMETNYWGVLRMCRAFAPRLARRPKACIANVLSIGSLTSVPFCGSYCAAKAAAWSLTQGVRAELGERGIRVAAIFPGPIATEMARADDDMSRRCPPDVMARTIVEALDAGETTIFPDLVSEGFAASYSSAPLADRFVGVR